MSFPTDVSPYGAFDLAGNAWEWTKDWYDAKYYQQFRTATADNPAGPVKPRSPNWWSRGPPGTGRSRSARGSSSRPACPTWASAASSRSKAPATPSNRRPRPRARPASRRRRQRGGPVLSRVGWSDRTFGDVEIETGMPRRPSSDEPGGGRPAPVIDASGVRARWRRAPRRGPCRSATGTLRGGRGSCRRASGPSGRGPCRSGRRSPSGAAGPGSGRRPGSVAAAGEHDEAEDVVVRRPAAAQDDLPSRGGARAGGSGGSSRGRPACPSPPVGRVARARTRSPSVRARKTSAIRSGSAPASAWSSWFSSRARTSADEAVVERRSSGSQDSLVDRVVDPAAGEHRRRSPSRTTSRSRAGGAGRART